MIPAQKKLRPASVTFEQANEAIRQRRDIPREEVDKAWSIGPIAVLALARTYPTADELTEAEKEHRRQLRMAEVRRVCKLAHEAARCIAGNLERIDDSTRRDVALLVGELRAKVFLLADWAQRDARGEVARPIEWIGVWRAAELLQVKEALHKTHSAIQSAIAETHVPKRRKKQA
jgi:hypothetical protein